MYALFRGFLMLIFPLVVVLCANGHLLSADLEVDNLRGSDVQAPGNSLRLNTPYRTLQRAIDDAVIGDRIKIRSTGQPYRESVSIHSNNNLGTPEFPLIIEGNGATFDGTKPLGALDWSATGHDLFELNVRSPGYVKILAASDQPMLENLGHLTDLSRLQPFQYARIQGSIMFRTRPGDVPQAYGLRVSVEQTGFTFYDVSNIVIRDLNIVGYRLDGINCHDLVNAVRFKNIVAENNGRSGISVGGASQVLFQGGKLQHNGESQARAEGQSRLELVGVTIDAEKTKSIDQAGGKILESQ